MTSSTETKSTESWQESESKKDRPRAGLFVIAPAVLLPSAAIECVFSRFLHTNRFPCRLKAPRLQQTVDGLHGVLEIRPRSSYVPTLPIGARSPVPGEACRLNSCASRAPGMPIWWMK